jgi:hypothetical protein
MARFRVSKLLEADPALRDQSLLGFDFDFVAVQRFLRTSLACETVTTRKTIVSTTRFASLVQNHDA